MKVRLYDKGAEESAPLFYIEIFINFIHFLVRGIYQEKF